MTRNPAPAAGASLNSEAESTRAPRVLLTGATGFVGPHAARAFSSEGFAVRALVRSPERARELEPLGAEIRIGDLQDSEVMGRACSDVDVVVHMAALTHARDEAAYRAVNVAGTRLLLDAALSAERGPRRFIYLSSLAAVGPAVDRRPVDAGTAPRPLTAYGRSKLDGECVCERAAGRIGVAILRAPAVYGPRDTDLYNFFRIARRGVIPVPTGPARPLQLVHVEDLARALVHAARAHGAAGVYHIAESRAYAWADVGSMVAAAVGTRARTLRVPGWLISGLAAASEAGAAAVGRSTIFNRDKARELLAPGWLCETESARAELNFETRIPLADGLRSTAQWYREHGWL
ncbi:NAD(P)-dependent oxidoreductase [soil metagenome]